MYDFQNEKMMRRITVIMDEELVQKKNRHPSDLVPEEIIRPKLKKSVKPTSKPIAPTRPKSPAQTRTKAPQKPKAQKPSKPQILRNKPPSNNSPDFDKKKAPLPVAPMSEMKTSAIISDDEKTTPEDTISVPSQVASSPVKIDLLVQIRTGTSLRRVRSKTITLFCITHGDYRNFLHCKMYKIMPGSMKKETIYTENFLDPTRKLSYLSF